jgi:hypothetical protein
MMNTGRDTYFSFAFATNTIQAFHALLKQCKVNLQASEKMNRRDKA